MLKLYLRSRYKMSPDEYRTKWGYRATIPLWRLTIAASGLNLPSGLAWVEAGHRQLQNLPSANKTRPSCCKERRMVLSHRKRKPPFVAAMRTFIGRERRLVLLPA